MPELRQSCSRQNQLLTRKRTAATRKKHIRNSFTNNAGYGFSFSATRLVALEKESASRIQQIFGQVIWAKILLALLGFVVMLFFAALWPGSRHDLRLFLCSYTLVLAVVVNTEWFFQGLQEMRYVTIAGLISRSVACGLVFLCVHHREDYYIVPFLTGMGGIAGGLVGQWIVWRRYHILLGRFDWPGIKSQMREGWDTFLSCTFISLYTTTNTFLLGLLTSSEQVGYYAAAERIITGIRNLWGPVPQALYPHFSRIFRSNTEAGKRQLRLILVLTGVATGLISLAGCWLAPWLVRAYLGIKFQPAAPIVQVMVFVILLIGINNILGIQGLLANGLSQTFRNIVLISGLLNIVALIVFVKIFGVIGAAMSVVFIEFLIVVMEWKVLRRKSIL